MGKLSRGCTILILASAAILGHMARSFAEIPGACAEQPIAPCSISAAQCTSSSFARTSTDSYSLQVTQDTPSCWNWPYCADCVSRCPGYQGGSYEGCVRRCQVNLENDVGQSLP